MSSSPRQFRLFFLAEQVITSQHVLVYAEKPQLEKDIPAD